MKISLTHRLLWSTTRVVLCCLFGISSSGQTFSGTGGSIITLTGTSRFTISVSGLSPATVNYYYGLESVTIHINHSQDRDIDCFLAAPDGTMIELTTDNGGFGDNYVNTVFRHDATQKIVNGSAPFTGNYSPEGLLWKVNNGQNGNGNWQLRVIDDSNNGVTGSVVNWSLTFSSTPAHPFIFDQSWLPIVIINTNGQTISDDPKIVCDLGIIDNGHGARNQITDPYNGYNGKIGIEIRGSSSQHFPKKSYGFETRDPSGILDSNVALLGMPAEHDWVLSANYSDKTLARNVLLYRLATEMGHYAVRTRYVDVVINGEYKGVYVLQESIKRDKNRVDIKKLHPSENMYPEISGGYILKIDKLTGSGGSGWTSPYQPINHSSGQHVYFQYDYPKPDSISISQEAYIQAYVDSFESALAGPNFRDSVLGFARFIGNSSFIDYFFCNEISKNVDGYRISSYLYKDKEKTLKAGPVWDYDIAWGNANYCSGDSPNGWAYLFPCTGDGYQVPFWWQKMLQDTNYANQVKCRWLNFRSGILSTAHINGIIDSIALRLDESKDWNFTVWPILGIYVWPNPSPYPSTYAGEIQNLKNWIASRFSWLDNNMPGNCSCNLITYQENPSCTNACDGIAAASGISPYAKTYLWDNGNPSDTLRNLCTGDYIITFEDAVGCRKTDTVTITQPALLSIQVNVNNSTCGGLGCNGSAGAIVNGGTGPYTYTWSSGQTTATVTGLCAGNDTLVVVDARGCSATKVIQVINPSAPVLTVSNQSNVSCYGGSDGSASVIAGGGTMPYSYQWSPSGGTGSNASGLAAGNYNVSVLDANGCQAQISLTITQPSGFSTQMNTQPVLCNGASTGSASVGVTGGTGPYQYNWLPSGGSNATASGLSAAVYTVTITDAHGCTSTSTAVIQQPQAMSLQGNSTPVNCFGGNDGAVSVSVSGGVPPYYYYWLPSGETSQGIDTLTAGNYTVRVTDANGCTVTSVHPVSQPVQMILNTGSSPAACGTSNGAASVSVSGGVPPYAYLWNPGGSTSSVASNLASGNYLVTVTDNHSCISDTMVNVGNASGLLAVVNQQMNVSCFGGNNGSAVISVSGGDPPYTYSWVPSGGTSASASGLTAGNYLVNVQDNSGCSTVAQVVLSQPPVLQLGTTSVPAHCFGLHDGSASVTVSGGTPGYSFQWSPSGGTSAAATGIGAGNYSVKVTDSNGCSATQPVTVSQPPAIQIAFAVSHTSCGRDNGTISAQVSGGSGQMQYSWFPVADSSTDISSLPAGTYTLTVTDSTGCTTSSNATVQPSNAVSITITGQQNVTCNGDSDGMLALNAGGGQPPYQYVWYPSVSTGNAASGLSAGVYSVVTTDNNGCMDSSGFIIRQPAPLSVLMFANNVTCYNAQDGIIYADVGGGTEPYTYVWSPGQQYSDSASSLDAGSYTVLVTDSNGCTVSSSATITEPVALTAQVTAQNAMCFGECDGEASVSVSGGEPPYYFSWCNGDTMSVVNSLCAGICNVAISDGNGCTVNQQVTVTEPPALQSSVTHTNETCQGCMDGTAAVVAGGGTPPYTYVWVPGNMTVSSVTGLVSGWYSVCVFDASGCQLCDSVEILDGTIGISEFSKASPMYIYPNPSSGNIFFAFALPSAETVQIDLLTLTGQEIPVLSQTTLSAGEHIISFDSGSLASGMYLFRFINETGRQVGRLFIQH
ncbi:MAG: CotH kinase family protein [Bacteroidia bacterium]|nr:CotH kinase family protein [Bacteroidia bacterium]